MFMDFLLETAPARALRAPDDEVDDTRAARKRTAKFGALHPVCKRQPRPAYGMLVAITIR
jgi:hypothetical protein